MKIEIRKNKVHSIERKHPWIFSGDINSDISKIPNGDIVTAVDKKKDFLARGHFQHATISLRLLTFTDEDINQDFFNQKISNAVEVRKQQNFFREDNNICRLVHGEGDNIPGLIIDYYSGAAVIQVD